MSRIINFITTMVLLSVFSLSAQNSQKLKIDSVLSNQQKILKKLEKNEGFKNRPLTNNMNMPTGYSLQKGEFKIGLGSTVEFALTDNIQLGTNILLYLFQIYNASLKVSLLNTDGLAVAAGVKYSQFSLTVFDDEETFNSFAPFIAISKDISPDIRLHISGHYSYFTNEDITDAEAESNSNGTSASGGLEFAVSEKTRFLAETGYDFTFKGIRAGGAFVWGWEHFRLKLGVNYFKPESSKDGFTLPSIGIWWRFKS